MHGVKMSVGGAGEPEGRTDKTTLLFWGLLWRSVVWYTLAGAVLGGFYGCAFVAVSVFSSDVSDSPDTSTLLWALHGVVALLGVTGAVAGWVIVARTLKQKMRPLMGAVVGSIVGVSSGGFPFLAFFYFFAFPYGAFLGGAYGLAVGLVDAFLVATITRAFFFPLSHVRKHRRVVLAVSVLGVLVIPGLWFVWWVRSAGYAGFGEMTGSLSGDALVYVGFPTLVLALVAEWLGDRSASWYERRAPKVFGDSAEEPALTRALHNRRVARLALYVALVLAPSPALAWGILAYHERTVLVDTPSGWIKLDPDGKRAYSLAPSQFQVFDVEERRPVYTLPLSEPETHDGESRPWSTNGELLATYDGEQVRVYDVLRASEIATLPARNVGKLALSRDGSVLAAGIQPPHHPTSEDRDPVLVWEREGEGWSRALPTYQARRGWSEEAVALSSDGNTLAISDYQDVHLWDTQSGHLLRSVRAPGDGLSADYSVAFSSNGELLAAGGSDGEVSVWCVREGGLLWTEAGHDRYVTALSFSSDGRPLVSGGIGGKVKLWRAENGELLETHGRTEEEVGSVPGVGFDPERGRVVSFDQADKLVRIWATHKRAPDRTSAPDGTGEDENADCDESGSSPIESVPPSSPERR